MIKKENPTILIILDGFGYSKDKVNNPIYKAKKPNIDLFLKHFPNTILQASGTYVGLPEGYVGNSQVGHITIGAGKIIKQPVTLINESIENEAFFKNKTLHENLDLLQNNNGTLHIMGLLSDKGVHSNISHLFAFIKTAVQNKIENIYIHPFLDGRDVQQKSAPTYLEQLDNYINKFPDSNIRIGSITGRFYAMDRDNNWSRIQKSYDVLTQPQDILEFTNWKDALNFYYSKNITDEYIPPTQLIKSSVINNNNGIILFNFRPERSVQITECFVNKNFNHFKTKKIDLSFFITPIQYDNKIKTDALFEVEHSTDSLLNILSAKGLKVACIAETEKYAHITYFIKGGSNIKLPNETDILIPSIKAKNYIEYPCMSAPEITKTVIDLLQKDPKDFYLINYANADMVGHSGNFDATVKAIECLDKQLRELYEEVVIKRNGTLYITADHGNAEDKKDSSTMHTTNPVPFIMVRQDLKDKNIKLPLKELADIKDFILKNIT